MFIDFKGRYMQIKKNNFIFKIPVIFENENFAAPAPLARGINCLFFGIDLVKIKQYPDRQQCVYFRKLQQKIVNHFTQIVTSLFYKIALTKLQVSEILRLRVEGCGSRVEG